MSTIAEKIKKGISLFIVVWGSLIGYRIAVIHRIKSRFDILLPIIFETAKSVFHEYHDMRLITSSGADDQNATIVSQITRAEIQNFFAIELAPSTSMSAHLMRRINQMIRNKYSMYLK